MESEAIAKMEVFRNIQALMRKITLEELIKMFH